MDEVESLRIILLRLRDALQCLCGREKDFGTLPVRFKHYCGAARYHSKPSGRLDMNRVEDLASQLDASRAVAAFALTKRWAGYMADVNEIVALMTVKAKKNARRFEKGIGAARERRCQKFAAAESRT